MSHHSRRSSPTYSPLDTFQQLDSEQEARTQGSERGPAHYKTGNTEPQVSRGESRESIELDSLDQEASSKTHRPFSSQRKGRETSFRLQDWKWELVAAAFSLSCLVAIVIVLLVFQDKPLSRWHVSVQITPNALISFLSTLSRAALLAPVASSISQLKWIHATGAPNYLSDIQVFDEASRGPWGALTLLWKLNARTKLAAWGSVITVLTLAMDPFVQQLLSYPTRNVYSDGALFPAAQIFDTSSLVDASNDKRGFLNRQIQGAILNGVYNLDSPVQLGCSTGNCEWPEFITLGVTSSCTNVTAGTEIGKGDNETFYTYRSPSGFEMAENFLHNSTSQLDTLGDDGNSANLTDSIVKMAIVNIKSPFSLDRPDVAECEMKWCARVFQNASVVNGTLSPGRVQDRALRFLGEQGNSSSSTITAAEDTRVTFTTAADGDDGPPSANSSSSSSRSSTFAIGANDWYLSLAFLASLFAASDDMGGNVRKAVDDAPSAAAMLANISTSMTYAIGNSPSAAHAAGKVVAQEQFIKVSWYWIILPAAETLMGLAFLGATLMYTRREAVVSWKSSSVLPFFARLDGWEDAFRRVESLDAVQGRAEGMRGILRQDEKAMLYFSRAGM